jgi:hypothetical protein
MMRCSHANTVRDALASQYHFLNCFDHPTPSSCAQDYTFEVKQLLRFVVIDVDDPRKVPTSYVPHMDEGDLLGMTETTMAGQQPETRNPKSYKKQKTKNKKPETLKKTKKNETRNPKPEARNPKPSTALNLEGWFLQTDTWIKRPPTCARATSQR